MTLAPGTRLGAYEVLSLLGQGGMGEVYRAHDTRPTTTSTPMEDFASWKGRRQPKASISPRS
jgi:hypothetical protein